MHKPVIVFQVLNQFLKDRRPKLRMHLLLRGLKNSGKHRERGDVAEAGELLQRLLRFDRQSRHLANQKIHHIIGVTLGVNAIEIPRPTHRIMIEAEQALFRERVKKLNDEERVAGGFLLHQLRQRRDMGRIAAKRIRDQLLEVVASEGRQVNLLNQRSGLAYCVELVLQRMSGIDLVVPVSADQHQVLQIRLGQQILQQVERGRVKPLQVVQEQRQRMFRPRKYPDKPPEHELKTALCLLRRKLRDRWLFSNDEFQFRHQVHNEQPVRPQRLTERLAPAVQIGLAFAQKWTDKALKGLGQRGVRNVALVLVEFA